jgi:DnaK suppressor protein
VNDDQPLSEAELDELRSLLLERKAEVERALASSQEDARPVSLDLEIGRVTRADAMQQQQLAAARRRRLDGQRVQIQQAFVRLDNGTYGECAICEEPIARARLRSSPEAPFCVSCQERRGQ